MLILVGLGNPEPKYFGNRHNLGFRAVDVIADRWSFGTERKRFQSLAREGQIPTPGKDGYWIHPVNGKLHVHTGEQICETVLLR